MNKSFDFVDYLLDEPLPEDINKIPKGEPFVCMFSGGKDCMLALSVACETGIPSALIHSMYTEEEEAVSVLHMQKQSLIERQAELMNISLEVTQGSIVERWPNLVRVLKKYARKGIKYVVIGDLVYTKSSVHYINLCTAAGLIPKMPLVNMPYEMLWKEMEQRKIHCLITSIKTPILSDDWLGRTYNRDTVNELETIGVDPFGEYTEFHTTVVNAALFKEPLAYNLQRVEGSFRDSRRILVCPV